MRREFKWTEHQIDKLNKVQQILGELSQYKPLTLRQIYYQLVGKGYIENKVSEYTMLSNLLKHARISGLIPWQDIEDRIRTYHDLSGWANADSFKDAWISEFLQGYKRDKMQSQGVYLEIWIEKDALSSIFTKVANVFNVPVVVCRGFSSVSFLNDYRERLAEFSDKTPILLYFGDFDPSGVEMLNAMETTLINELGLTDVEFKRIALIMDQIEKYGIPHSPNALKKTDTRAKSHLAKYGELAVELDALNPSVLSKMISDAILNEIDLRNFSTEIEIEKIELHRLDLLKQKVTEWASKL